MRTVCFWTAIAAALLLAGPTVAQAPASAGLRSDIDFAKSKVYPALVNISVVAEQYFGGRAQRAPGAGSGAIVSAAGHVITNFHVAGNTTRIVCTLPTGERIDADVVAHDPLTDLSVLKLRLDERENPGDPLQFATLGNSDALQVGDYVLAMGNPLTLSSSLTLGVVSNTKRVFTDFTGTEIGDMDLGDGERTGVFTRWLQHDALILPGNSGGPLVNLRGEIVGINELGGSGVGFAIPSNLTAKVLNHVLTFGEVRRGWLGLSVLPVSKLGETRGALVSSVVKDSPAAAAGLQPGDVLMEVAGKPLNVVFFEEVPLFYQMVAEMVPGSKVDLQFHRGGSEHDCTVQVARMEKFLGEQVQLQELGLTIRDITAPMALIRQFRTADGVLVTGIRPGHAFEEARPRVQRGDIVVSFGDMPTPDLATFKKAYAKLQKDEASEASLHFWRGEQSIITTVDIAEDEDKPSGGELAKAWLGAQTQVMTPGVAKAIGKEGTRGFRVTEVYPWTEAERGGLKIGDIIVEVDDEELDAYRQQDAQDLRIAIEDFSIGEEVGFVVVRDGKRVELTIKTEATPSPSLTAEKTTEKVFEFAVRELTFMDRVKSKLGKDQKGLLVTSVTSGGWGFVAGLRVRDVLMTVEGTAIGSIEDFTKAMKEVQEREPKVVRLFVKRGHRTHFVFIEPVWEKAE
ncbi:MAG: PDZ domain-containing protein [Planctomycetota bacterium]